MEFLTVMGVAGIRFHSLEKLRVLREERQGLLDGSDDVNPDVSPGTLDDYVVNPRPKRLRVWHLREPATVDNSCDGHKLLKLHASFEKGCCGK